MNMKSFIFILVITVSLGVAFLLLKDIKEFDTDEDSAGFVIGENAIYVVEQMPSRTISAAIVRLEKPGFVVIHEDRNGTPGNILGVSGLLADGETNSVQITLSRSTLDGETVYAMLHLDDGDKMFDVVKDKPALDRIGGEPVMTIVSVIKDAVEPGAVNP
jgi:hypothetical protein